MLEAIVSSKTRIKLLLKFFLNAEMVAYLRGLETELGESTNGIRVELNRMEDAGLLKTYLIGNKKMFRANEKHPLFKEIHNILRKHIGLDQIIDKVVHQLGDVQEVYLTGDFANGMDSPIIDLVFIGNIEKNYLVKLVGKAEAVIERKVRYLIFTSEEFASFRESIGREPHFLIWAKEED